MPICPRGWKAFGTWKRSRCPAPLHNGTVEKIFPTEGFDMNYYQLINIWGQDELDSKESLRASAKKRGAMDADSVGGTGSESNQGFTFAHLESGFVPHGAADDAVCFQVACGARDDGERAKPSSHKRSEARP